MYLRLSAPKAMRKVELIYSVFFSLKKGMHVQFRSIVLGIYPKRYDKKVTFFSQNTAERNTGKFAGHRESIQVSK